MLAKRIDGQADLSAFKTVEEYVEAKQAAAREVAEILPFYQELGQEEKELMLAYMKAAAADHGRGVEILREFFRELIRRRRAAGEVYDLPPNWPE
ncbi:hypothetical protein [Albidovulum sediminis]|uniref:Uncharacterized protein n=1 Tax=Albidovulum sediminis TaxID=3066345 RepID=A0ABT2NJL8_9RHOB|nr:hypothetical protein [Defluviimonas sediminis]MCT8328273.1 hypothetical protein [Defluviimonas sediminis]